jgi:lipid-A-disaccharide synthase-like uncharacterized protein
MWDELARHAASFFDRIPAGWLLLGFAGQVLFSARFLVQWIVSERRRASVVPVAFWWLSLGGGAVLFAYGVHRRDPVIIAGQLPGVVVYTRNLMLIRRRAQEPPSARSSPAAP